MTTCDGYRYKFMNLAHLLVDMLYVPKLSNVRFNSCFVRDLYIHQKGDVGHSNASVSHRQYNNRRRRHSFLNSDSGDVMMMTMWHGNGLTERNIIIIDRGGAKEKMRRGCTKHPEYRSVGWNSESIITQSHNKFYSRWRCRSSVLLIIILLLEFSFCLIVVVVLEFFISTVGALALTLIWWLPRSARYM